MAERVNVTKSQMPDRQKLHAYIDRILDSGWLTNYGQCVQELERRLEAYLGVRNVVLVGNATIGLQVAYRALGVRDEVITTPFSFIATASSLVWEGCEVAFADIDQQSFNIDAKEIERKITSRTSAIVPVHVFGNPCDVEAIAGLAHAHDLKVIYDAAHAFGVRYKGESVLNWGDISVLSFHATKLFHTVEGGALIINNDEICEKVRNIINFGIVGPESIICLGINAKLSEFHASMGLCLLDDMETAIDRREVLAGIYDSILNGVVIKQNWMVEATRNYGYYPVLFKDEASLLRVISALNSNDIYPRRYFYPTLDSLEFITATRCAPVSRDVASRILCLPLFSDLADEKCREIGYIVLGSLREEVGLSG